MDNEDTIRNLISYGDEKSENAEAELKEAEESAPAEEEIPEDETKRIEIPHEMSSMEQPEEDDEGEEYFSSEDEKNNGYAEEYEFYDEYSAEEEPVSAAPGKKKIIIYALSAVGIFILMTVFSLLDTGVIGTYKKNVTTNLTKIFDNMGIDITKKPIPTVGPLTDTSAISEDSVSGEGKQEQMKVKATPEAIDSPEYNTETQFSALVPFESAAEADFSTYKKGIVCAKTNYLCYIGPTGKTEWETATSVVDPILKSEGDYIFVAQRGGTKICMYSNGELLYDTDTSGNILSCAVSTNGDAVVVMNKQSYKGALSVYNKGGNEIYAWSSGSDVILSADISESSRRVAASLINTDSQVKSTIMLFNINKENSYASAEFKDTVLFDVVFTNDDISAFGDNSMVGMNTAGKVMYDKRFDDVELTNYSIDDSGTRIMAFNSENLPMMNIYNSAGVLKYTVTTRSQSDYADIAGYNLIYNDNRDVFLGKPNSTKVSKFTASMDIQKIILIDSRTFVLVYSNSLEFVKM